MFGREKKCYFQLINLIVLLYSGTDGRSYRSPCFVKYFNCLADTNIQIDCHRECPCNDTSRIYIFIKNNIFMRKFR